MDINRKVVYKGKWISMIVANDKWEYASRTKGSGAVIIPSMTKDDELIFVEQYRIPVDANTIEWPAGMVGDEDDSEEHFTVAATRELMEETGYYPGRTFPDPHAYCSTAGAVDEMVHYVTCLDCEKRGEGGGVDDENIKVHLIKFDEVEDWLLQQQEIGKIVDAKLHAGLYRILRLHVK